MVAVEFAAWLPVFALTATGIADVALQLAWRANLDRATIDTAHALARREIVATEADAYLRSRIYIGDTTAIEVNATTGTEATVFVTRSGDRVFTFSIAQYVINYLPDGYLSSAQMLIEPG